MIRIPLKSISLNATYKVWPIFTKKGKKCWMYLSKEAKQLKENLMNFFILNNIKDIYEWIDFWNKKLKLHLIKNIWVSNIGSDVDNSNKLFQDVLADYLKFNDNKIYKQTSKKEKVKKWEEFIEFELEEIT